MLFLLNDKLFNLNREDLSPQVIERRFASVSFGYVQQLGQELFSESPVMQRVHPEQGAKLAALISAKSPEINAALFVAPSQRCKPAQVGVRFASIDVVVMARLHTAEIRGNLDAATVDREVWRLLAA
ncbi:MAG: hypothetical protein JWO72_2938 [Caulobacteraceae bacterium]|jgi:hypothetical protein|nr:hypothetical protein [Caulobacteraceae bacterium]